jgi:putative acetyltransferase
MTTVRPERPQDQPVVRRIHERAFGQPLEAELVDRLRTACPDALSLVAEAEAEVVGHILFTPVIVESDGGHVLGMGLAPMAVVPERQRRGIGAALARRGLDLLRERECPFVVVVGHPDYYPRFGFDPASKHGLACQWQGVPDDAFMALVLDPRRMSGVSGVARYRPEFDTVA